MKISPRYLLASLSAVIAIGALYFFYGIYTFGQGWCGNTVIGRAGIEQPYEAVVFVRNCGATTDWSVQVALLPKDQKLTDDDKGNIFIVARGSSTVSNGVGGPYVYAGWDGKNPHLYIRYPKGVEIFHQVSNFDGINITYSPLPDIDDLGLSDAEKDQLLGSARTYVANHSVDGMGFELIFLKRSGDRIAFKVIPHNMKGTVEDEAWLYVEKKSDKWTGIGIGTAMIELWEETPELNPWQTRLNQ